MSKLNKLVSNYPVVLTKEEVANLSSTLLPVVEACGGGGGGGITQYYGDGTYTEITGSHVITLTNETKQKINREIPTKVSDLTDSANYQTVEGMGQYLTEAEAQATYLTKSSADTLYAPLSTTAEVETLKAASGDFSQYYTKNETYSKNEVYTKEDVYQKTETSSKSELTNAFIGVVTDSELETAIGNVNQTIYDLQDTVAAKQDTLTFGYDENNAISSINSTALAGQGGTTYSAGQYINIDANDTISVTGVLALDEYAQYEPVLIGDSNITATSSKVNSHTQWNLRINATPVTTDTTLKGENVVTAHTTNVSGEWAVGLVQSAYEAIDSVGGIATDVGTLKTASGDWNKVSAKLDTTAFSDVSGSFLTAHQNLDDYYTKTQVDSTFASATQLNDYLTTATYQTDSGTFLTKSSADNDYAPISITATVNTLTAASAGWNEASAKLGTAQYATDSATFYTTSNPAGYLTKTVADTYYQPTGYYATTAQLNTASSTLTGVDNLLSGHIDYVSGQFDNKLNVPLSSDVSIQDKYLVLRTNANGTVSGWCDFQDQSYSKSEANGTFVATANIDTTTLSGDGKSVSTKLGVKTDVIATRDYVNSSFLPLTGGTVSGQLEVHGGSNFDSQFIKLTREGNSCGARIGLGNDTTNGTLALKTFNSQGQNTVQVNIKHNTNNNELIQVQKGGSDIGFLIPAVTSTTTAGLTNDGILHIIVES